MPPRSTRCGRTIPRPPTPCRPASGRRLRPSKRRRSASWSQLETTSTLRGHLEQQFEEYRAEQTELDAIRIQAREATRLGRITLILWARSHRNLAGGVKVPAAINLMGMVQSAAGKATGIALP
jgi:hypothetical protein